MPKIKHFALTTSDPGKVAGFYKQAFDLIEVRRDSKGQVFLSDGEFNMAISRFKTGEDPDVGAQGPNFSGIHHIWFYVEDLEAQAEKLKRAGGEQLTPTVTPGTGGLYGSGREPSKAEVKFSGPDGVIIDMSESGWQISS